MPKNFVFNEQSNEVKIQTLENHKVWYIFQSNKVAIDNITTDMVIKAP